MDFFVVPTVTFRALYCWFCEDHARRRILHVNVTEHPTSDWVIQRLRRCWPFGAGVPRYLLSDRDAIFGRRVSDWLAGAENGHKRISYQSPWQNGVAERWVGSVRRELLGHVIILNESHPRRLLREYVEYYNRDRPHLTLGKDSPESRPPSARGAGKVIAFPRVGGLHHRYEWAQAA
jgi:transposase InsO family protein